MKFVENRPYDSAALTVASAGFILAIGIILLRGLNAVGDHSTASLVLVLVGTFAAAGIIASGILLLFFPGRHRLLGSIIMILTIATFSGTSGGLYIGAIGSFLGGIMSISWKRKKAAAPENISENGHNA